MDVLDKSSDVLSKSLDTLTLIEKNISEQTQDGFESIKQKGNELFVSKNYETALEKYTEAFEKANDDVQKGAIFHNRGMTYELLNNNEKALEEYREALELNPKYYKALKRRAALYIKLDQPMEAREDLVKMLCIEKETQVEMSMKTCEQITTVNQELGRRMALEVMENQSKKPKMGRIEEIEFFLRTLICDPVSLIWSGKIIPDIISNTKNDSGYGAAVKALIDKRYEVIIDLCTEEINNADSEYLHDAYFLRGTFRYLWGYGKETLDDFEKILEANRAHVTNKIKSSAALKCALYYTTRTLNKDEMEKWFSKAELLWKENCDVYHRCAMMLIEDTKFAEGNQLLSKAAEVFPEKDYPIFFKTLAIATSFEVASDHKEPEEALSETVVKLKELEPLFDTPECYDVYANALVIQGKAHEAEAVYKKAMEVYPNSPSFQVKKVLTQYQYKEAEEAFEEFSKALEMDEEYNVAHFHMGIAELNRGNYDKGMQHFRRSLELTRNIVDTVERATLIVEYELHYELCKILGLDPLEKATT